LAYEKDARHGIWIKPLRGYARNILT